MIKDTEALFRLRKKQASAAKAQVRQRNWSRWLLTMVACVQPCDGALGSDILLSILQDIAGRHPSANPRSLVGKTCGLAVSVVGGTDRFMVKRSPVPLMSEIIRSSPHGSASVATPVSQTRLLESVPRQNPFNLIFSPQSSCINIRACTILRNCLAILKPPRYEYPRSVRPTPRSQALAKATAVAAAAAAANGAEASAPAPTVEAIESGEAKLMGVPIPPPNVSVALRADSVSEGRRDVVRAMFEVAWWPMLGAFSQVGAMERSIDGESGVHFVSSNAAVVKSCSLLLKVWTCRNFHF